MGTHEYIENKEPSSPPKERVGNINGSNDVENTKLTYAEALKKDRRGKKGKQESLATGFDKTGNGANKKVSFFLFNPVR